MMKNKKMMISVVTLMAVGFVAVGANSMFSESQAAESGAEKKIMQTSSGKNPIVYEVESDYENGKKVYEIEFEQDGYEYDYTVDAETKEILSSEKEQDDDYVEKQKETVKENSVKNAVESEITKKEEQAANIEKPQTNQPKDIGRTEALRIALAHAGLTENQVKYLEVEREMDDGRLEYGVEFISGQKEYDYEMDGATGQILECDIEIDD